MLLEKAETLAPKLNGALRNHGAVDVLSAAREAVPELALVSSFGAESVILLHLASIVDRNIPILFIDTEMLFEETLLYQVEVAERLQLGNVQVIRASEEAIKAEDPRGTLHLRDKDACCNLRKTRPLAEALKSYDGWITGRKRFQGGQRVDLEFFEAETGTGRIKVNPLARWSIEDIRTYIDENRLPRHPLVSRGYPSIGCQPCTSPVKEGEDLRAGRWRGEDKEECGIHFINGKLVRGPVAEGERA